MDCEFLQYSRAEWEKYSPKFHELIFGEVFDPAEDKCSYAIVAAVEGEPAAFMSGIELGARSFHIQYGGVFVQYRGTGQTRQMVSGLLSKLSEVYDTVSCRVKNDNLQCLIMLLKSGFSVVGTKTYDCGIYLEMSINLGV